MLLTKEIAVYLNLVACRFRQYTANLLKKNNIGLTPEQFLTIDILWNEGPMPQYKIADAMRKDKNSVTNLVDSLEKKLLVERTRNREDRRSNLVTLTPKAEAMKNEAKQFGISMLDNLLKGIDEEELQSFLATLKKIDRAMFDGEDSKESPDL